MQTVRSFVGTDVHKETISISVAEGKESDGGDTEPVCPHVTTAILTHGGSIGKRLPICADQNCPVHRPKHTYTPEPDFEQRQQEAQRKRDEKQKEREKREKALRALFLCFPSTATDQQTRFLLKALVTGYLANSLGMRVGSLASSPLHLIPF